MTEEPISAKGAARTIGTDARTLRKFLRSSDSPFAAVGQGRRYEFTQQEVEKLKRKFDKWNSRRTNSIEVEAEPLDDSIEELEID